MEATRVRALVTGNLGYIGPVVVRRLREAGLYVIGLDTGWYVNQYAEPPYWPDQQIVVDARDVVSLASWSEGRVGRLLPGGIDYVVHLAGLSNDPLGSLDPYLTKAINYDATIGIMHDLPTSRHLFISSCSVYGQATNATEATTPRPQTEYARQKANVDEWARNSSIETLSLRLGTVFGYSPGHRLDLVVNKMVYDALNGGVVKVYGASSRPLVHVEDVASAVEFMLLQRTEQGVYNVVGENWDIGVLGKAIAHFAGADVEIQDGDADKRDYQAYANKIKAIGWEPRHTVMGSLPVLAEKTLALPPRIYTRLGAIQSLLERGLLDPTLRSEVVTA